MLSNSYAFAYFFFGGDLFKGEFTEEQNQINQNLFEDSQEQLAMEVRFGRGGFPVWMWCVGITRNRLTSSAVYLSLSVQLWPRCCVAAPPSSLPPSMTPSG